MHKNIPMICTIFFLSCLDTKTHAAGAQKSRLNGRIPKCSQNTGPKPMHKDLSSVLTSCITYGYSKGTQRNRLSEATPMSSHTTCQSQCTLVGITCILVGTQRYGLDETTPTSSQSTCLNQCTGESPLHVPPFHIWRQKSYVVGTRGNPLMRQLPRAPKTHV